MLKIKKIINNKYFTVNYERFFFVNIDNKRFAIPDKCPHRGGPLSLGGVCQEENSIQCPWHETKFKILALLKKEISAVRISNQLFYIEERKCS
jgi:nitrite reductase/ring-hydroxylating ferredoxin subunit